jgi:uncharacterized protein YkwD
MTVAARAIHHASLMVIPHPANDHRPYFLRHRPLAFISTLLIAAKLAAIVIIGLTPTTADLSTITSSRILQLTNAERTKRGLNALTVNDKLTRAAEAKGEDMLAHNYFAHISPTGVTPWYWMKQQGYQYEVAGENLAIDFTQAEDVVTAWLNSPTHKENMLLPEYTETGIAAVTGEFDGGTSTIVVHMFGKPLAGKVAAQTITATPTPAAAPAPSSTPLPTGTPTAAPSPTTLPVPIVPPVVPPAPPQEPTSYILNPQIDQGTMIREQGTNLSGLVNIQTVAALTPTFNHNGDDTALQAPARFVQLVRRMFEATLITITILLLCAIVVRIRVQHPALIAHATFVILLAAVLLLR